MVVKNKHLAVKVRRTSVVQYYQRVGNFYQSVKHKENEKNLSRGVYNGFLSKKAQRNITDKIEVWVDGVQQNIIRNNHRKWGITPYFTFITLTLSAQQQHTDNEIKRQLLNPFIIWMREDMDVRNYLWKAEKQKNGNIHFHILLDRFIAFNVLRDKWNVLQSKMGYLQRYTEKMSKYTWHQYMLKYYNPKKMSKDKLFQVYNYNKKRGWKEPNSTDIHKIQKVNSLAAYISKYMSKKDDSIAVEGRLWGCSDGVRSLMKIGNFIDSEVFEELSKMELDSKVKNFSDKDFNISYFSKEYTLKEAYPKIYKLMVLSELKLVERIYYEEPQIFLNAPSLRSDSKFSNTSEKPVQLRIWSV